MKKYSLREHFVELKSRTIQTLLFFTVAFIFSYYFSDHIYSFLLQPLAKLDHDSGKKIIYTGLAEAFFTYLKLSSFAAFVLTFPILCLQIYRFMSPGLLTNEKIIILFALIFSPILFFAGGFFVFYLVMPKAWEFFLSFENNNLEIPLILEAKISEYLSLVMQLITVFGLAFQMPIIMLVLNVMGLVSSKALIAKRRLAIVINFIIAAIFTPPDVLSQIALAIPLVILYEVSIVMCKFVENRGKNVRSKMD